MVVTLMPVPHAETFLFLATVSLDCIIDDSF